MIKIKDYIFNENEIREIKQCKNYLRLDLTYSGPYLHIDDTTFEDIEWNYGGQVSSQVEDTPKHFGEKENQAVKNIIKKNSVILNENYKDFYEDKIKELEEENKKNEDYFDSTDYLSTRINKAIDYINYWGIDEEHNDDKLLRSILEVLLKILKGEE